MGAALPKERFGITTYHHPNPNGGKKDKKKCKGNKSGIKKISQFSQKIVSGRVDTLLRYNCMLTRNGIWDSSYLLKKVAEVRIENAHGVSLSTSNLGFNQIQDALWISI